MTKGKEFNDWLLNRLGELGWEQGELASRAAKSLTSHASLVTLDVPRRPN